jgi:hypothetical protein
MDGMQFSFPSKKQILAEIAILNTPTYREAGELFAGYVHRLQQAATASELRLLQRELILDLNARQKALAEVVAEHAAPAKARIRELTALEPKPKEELRAAQARLDGVAHARLVADALQHATRVLADGMVWRALDYDRPTISILGKEQPVARHADDVGFDAELAAIDLVESEHGFLTFHNDTTNILRRGDITSIVIEDGRPFPLPREVKAGKADGAKQVERIRQALLMILTRRFVVPVPFETHLEVLAELVAEAKRSGYAKAKLDCHFVQVVDYRHFAGREEQVEELARQSLAELGWSTGDRLILAGMSSVSRIRDRGNPVVELAPTSIFPLPPDDVADLLLGFVDTSVHLNTELLGLRFAERGLRAGFAVHPASATHFLEVRRGYRGFLMPAYVREQMLHELMTVETLTTLADWIIDSGKTREWSEIDKAPILGFADEGAMWAPDAVLELAA